MRNYQHDRFEFSRERGIVWVCDLVDSSMHLNDEETVDALEIFLQRFYWTASLLVGAAGGYFVKWTGDGFLAWFKCELRRHLSREAANVLEAAWHLSVLVNVTQLGIEGPRKFRVRHGVTYEPDALVTAITYPSGHQSIDLIGRSVVLAFRLSGIPAAFPGVTTQRAVVEAVGNLAGSLAHFRWWEPNAEERLKFFKGEEWGTGHIYVSAASKKQPGAVSDVLTTAKAAIQKTEGSEPDKDESPDFARAFLTSMLKGPSWCTAVVEQYIEFIQNDLLGSLKEAVEALEKVREVSIEDQNVDAPHNGLNGA